MKLRLAERDESGLVRHGTLLMAGTMAGAACNAGFHMVVGRTLPGAEYGSLAAMLGVVLAATTPMLALQNTLAHFVSKLAMEGKKDEILDLFLHWVVRFAAITALVAACAAWYREPLAAFWGGVDPALVVATFAVLAASLWMNLFYGLLQGMQAFVWLAWAPQAWGATRLALGWAFTAWLAATALSAVVAQGVGVLAVLGLCAWGVSTLGLRRAAVRARRPRGTYRYLGASLFCLAGYAMLMNLDATLAKHYFDAETAGLFAKAATIARTAVFLPVPVATVLFPKVTSAGEMTEESWRLLRRALGFAGLLICGAAGACAIVPQLPWTILYGAWAPEQAAEAAALTRAMALAAAPLAVAYLLLNFQMAQRRFRAAAALVPCGLAYVGGVAVFHDRPMQIAAVLGCLNVAAAATLAAAVFARRRTAR